jgi:hypothetical protein
MSTRYLTHVNQVARLQVRRDNLPAHQNAHKLPASQQAAFNCLQQVRSYATGAIEDAIGAPDGPIPDIIPVPSIPDIIGGTACMLPAAPLASGL